jgi:hypothetical protein
MRIHNDTKRVEVISELTSTRNCWADWNWTRLAASEVLDSAEDREEIEIHRRADHLRAAQVEGGTPPASEEEIGIRIASACHHNLAIF